MKTAILLLISFLIMSCSITAPDETYLVNTLTWGDLKSDRIYGCYTTSDAEYLEIDGQQVRCWNVDWIEVYTDKSMMTEKLDKFITGTQDLHVIHFAEPQFKYTWK